MPKIPIISGKKLIKILVKNGFIIIRQKGSHVFIESLEKSNSTVVPLHKNEDLGKGLLKSILNDLNISVTELIEML